MAELGYMRLYAARVKVCYRWLGLLRLRMNAGPVCNYSAVRQSVCKCGTMEVKLTFYRALQLEVPDC